MAALRARETIGAAGFGSRDFDSSAVGRGSLGPIERDRSGRGDMDRASRAHEGGAQACGAVADAAVRLFERMKDYRRGDSDLVFPGQRKGKPLSDMTLTKALRDMGRDEAHGFRSTFRDWVAEQTSWPAELAKRTLKQQGAALAALWVRENGPGKGGHVHILMHLPASMNLRNRTRRWIVAAGGTYRRKVSKIRSIGGRLDRAESDPALYWANADAVLAYVLKAVDPLVGEAMGLDRGGEGGTVIGKRAGWTQNIGLAARS